MSNNATPDIIHLLDQAGQSSENIAELMKVYYEALKERELPEELAQSLVLDYQKAILSPLTKGQTVNNYNLNTKDQE